MGPPASTVCQCNVDKFVFLCAKLGVPLATDKLEGPSTSLSFLGNILDTNQMEIRLPTDKLNRMQELLTSIDVLPSKNQALCDYCTLAS